MGVRVRIPIGSQKINLYIYKKHLECNVERKKFKWILIGVNVMNRRRNIGTICLAIAVFLNPLGFAELAALIMNVFSIDYWTTMHIFYVSAFLFFLLYLFLYDINPIKLIIGKIKMIFRK